VSADRDVCPDSTPFQTLNLTFTRNTYCSCVRNICGHLGFASDPGGVIDVKSEHLGSYEMQRVSCDAWSLELHIFCIDGHCICWPWTILE
jgi:hypothetical protein